MNVSRRTFARILLVAGASVAIAPSFADYPEHPVRMVVGFPPGQATDVIAREMSRKLMDALPGSSFVVENRPGAAGILGHIQIRADEDSFAAHLAAGTQVGET